MSGGAAGNQQSIGSQGRPQLGGMPAQGMGRNLAQPLGVPVPTPYNTAPDLSQLAEFQRALQGTPQVQQPAPTTMQPGVAMPGQQGGMAVQAFANLAQQGGMPAQGVKQNLIDAYNRPQVQQPVGGFPGRLGGAPDLSQDAYRQHLATALYRSQADIPTYEQWVQQRQAPMPIPQVSPRKQGVPVGGMPQNDTYFPVGFPQKPGLTQVPRPQVLPRAPSAPTPFNSTPARGLTGLAGLANAIRGRQ